MILDRILRAWTDPGRVPALHRKQQDRLRREWPTLARALDAAATGGLSRRQTAWYPGGTTRHLPLNRKGTDMNVNLMQYSPWVVENDEPPIPLMQALGISADVLAMHHDTRPIYAPVLVPDDQRLYPGSYQVWFPTDEGWVYVTPSGLVVHADSLPAHDTIQTVEDE